MTRLYRAPSSSSSHRPAPEDQRRDDDTDHLVARVARAHATPRRYELPCDERQATVHPLKRRHRH